MKQELYSIDRQRKAAHKPFFSSVPIQAKWQVNQPGDRYEHEADAMASRVMRMSDGDTLQRKCTACDQEDLMRFSAPDSGAVQLVPDSVQEVLSSGRGVPLQASTRQFMEERMGADFSSVRIHTDEKASESAADIGAKAFATGNNIVFSKGAYRPETKEGKQLLAHELVHTIQQGAAKTTEVQVQRQAQGVPPIWCKDLLALVEYERQHGKILTVLRYHPLNHSLLVDLNHDIPSIYGPVDVDWMLRLSYSQLMPLLPGSIPSVGDPIMGAAQAYSSYFPAKLGWNVLRSFSDNWSFELGSIFQEANIAAPRVLAKWLHGDKSLAEIFAPALAQCR